ncbi:Cytoskeleton associated protein 5, partial [Cichlidogyrus casuarinus]
MADENEWKKLPTIEKIEHQQWKARLEGYNEALKLFPLESEDSPVFGNYIHLMKKIAKDSNAVAQEKGLELLLCFLDTSKIASKCAQDVCPVLVGSAIGSARAKTRDLAVENLLKFIELEKQDVVIESLVTGLSQKQPKIVQSSAQALRQALSLFGKNVIPIKTFIKPALGLLEAREAPTRDASKSLFVEMYRWAGAAIEPQLSGLKQVLLDELKAEFSKTTPAKRPERYLKSQKPTQVEVEVVAGAVADEEEEEVMVEDDPYDLADPVDILSKIPSDFNTNMESKKWQERQEGLKSISNLLDNAIKLQTGDYGDLFKSLIKVVGKDTNVMLVAQAAKLLCQLAQALRKHFQPFSMATITCCIDKFKEKKPTVVAALRDLIDAAVRPIPSLDSIVEPVVEALGNKNPSIRAEIALFLMRAFKRCTREMLPKKVLKAYIMPLCKTCQDTVPEVRDSSFDAIAATMLILGENALQPFLADVDQLRVNRIKESLQKLKGDQSSETAPPKKSEPVSPKEDKKRAKEETTKVVPKKTPVEKTAPKAVKTVTDPNALPSESEMNEEAALEKCREYFGQENVKLITAPNWKERLAAAQDINTKLDCLEPANLVSQAVCKLLLVNPGLKDSNFQVLKLRFDLLTKVFTIKPLCSQFLAEMLFPDVVDKIGDVKAGQNAKDCLTALANATKYEIVGLAVLKAASTQKSPKTQAECFNWLFSTATDFGFCLPGKEVVPILKTALAASSAEIRKAALSVAGIAYLYLGDRFRAAFEGEKPAVEALLKEEFDKYAGQKPPPATKGAAARVAQSSTVDDVQVDVEKDAEQVEEEEEELFERIDISDKVTSAMLEKFNSKNWKERKESLDEITGVLDETKKSLKNGPNLPEILTAIAKMATDVNKILGKSAVKLVENFGVALSKSDCQKLVKNIMPHLLAALNDSKEPQRKVVVDALNLWAERATFLPMTQDEFLLEALEKGTLFVRTELFLWLGTQLKDIKHGGAKSKKLPADFGDRLAPQILAGLLDRDPKCRKNVQDALQSFVRALGNPAFARALKKVPEASRGALQAQFDEAREAVMKAEPAPQPVAVKVVRPDGETEQPPGPSKRQSVKPVPVEEPDEPVEELDEPIPKKKTQPAKGKALTSKKEAELRALEAAAAIPPLLVNNLKSQRFSDEKKRKLLKWDFDAPTKEHVAQLNGQWTSIGAANDLVTQLCHTDFKQFIKALDTLQKLLDGIWTSVDGFQAVLSNLDLILKWMVLRFFETNPVVLGKSLDLCKRIFYAMADQGIALAEIEAQSFMPYLVMKAGDSKDVMRQEVRAILEKANEIYPPERMYVFVAGGLKSKVNKARQECLCELGRMILDYGIDICQPSPKPALKQLATQIGDRDSGVRTAALNALVGAYDILGEQLYKILGS